MLPPDLAGRGARSLRVIALPEEVFYRGYLQTALDEAIPPLALAAHDRLAIPLTASRSRWGTSRMSCPRAAGGLLPSLLFGGSVPGPAVSAPPLPSTQPVTSTRPSCPRYGAP
jgi:hypothetical protein